MLEQQEFLRSLVADLGPSPIARVCLTAPPEEFRVWGGGWLEFTIVTGDGWAGTRGRWEADLVMGEFLRAAAEMRWPRVRGRSIYLDSGPWPPQFAAEGIVSFWDSRIEPATADELAERAGDAAALAGLDLTAFRIYELAGRTLAPALLTTAEDASAFAAAGRSRLRTILDSFCGTPDHAAIAGGAFVDVLNTRGDHLAAIGHSVRVCSTIFSG